MISQILNTLKVWFTVPTETIQQKLMYTVRKWYIKYFLDTFQENFLDPLKLKIKGNI